MSDQNPNPRQQLQDSWPVYGLLVALWLFHVLANLIWLKVDSRPPFWDSAGHSILAIWFTRLPFSTDFPAAVKGLFTSSAYPPLMHWLSAPLAGLLWPTTDVLLGINALFWAILLGSTYGLASTFGGRRAGLLAAFLISVYPLVYGLSRFYMTDFPLVALVALSNWLLVWTDDFRRRRTSVGYGVTLGLGLLTKWAYAIFVAGPLLVAVVRGLATRSRARFINMALAAVVGLAVALPWYAWNVESSIAFFGRQAIFARSEGDPVVGSLASWSYYLRSFVTDQVFLPLALLFVVGLIVWLINRRPSHERWLLLSWIGVTYLLSSLFDNKDVRYTMPYLPAVAVITALGLMQLRPRVVRRGLVAVTMLYALLQFAGLTWGLSHRLPAGLLPARVSVQIGSAELPLYAEGVHIASPPRVEDWQMQAIVHDVAHLSPGQTDADPVRLAVLPDAAWFEQNGFKYYALVERVPVLVVEIADIVQFEDARTRVLTSDYLVTKTGNLGPAWSTGQSVLFTAELHDPGSELAGLFELVREYELPDGSIGELYRRVP